MLNIYPYSDMHELNLDYILAKVKELDERVDKIAEEIAEQVEEDVKQYIDDQLALVIQEFNDMKSDYDQFKLDVEGEVNGLEQDFINLTGEIDTFMYQVNLKIQGVKDYVDAQIVATNARTDAAIIANNQMILDQLSQYLSNITVINFFTGEAISIQDMFDYLAMLHVNDSIDYATLASRNKTYTDIAALNITYTDVVLHGNTLIV